MTRAKCWFTVPIIALFVLAAAPTPTFADGDRVRITRMDGRVVEGELVEETADAYKVKYSTGITVTLRKNEVRKLDRATVPAPGASGGAVTRGSATPAAAGETVTDADIATIIGEQDFDFEDVAEAEEDILASLPMDEASIAEMKRIAGSDSKLLSTDHFALIYTSDASLARDLASRLEAIYRWNFRFTEMLGLTPKRPNYKLEIYLFGTYKEYKAYQSLQGFDMPDALGFYMRTNNRSAFFDMNTSPDMLQMKEALSRPGVDYKAKQYITNRMRRQQDFFNMTVIQHEAAHHIQFNMGIFNPRGDMPKWLTEGCAQMFELPPGSTGGSLGTTNHLRLLEYRMIYGKEGDRISDFRLFVVSDSQWQGGASYSLGWSLVDYLFRKHRPAFAKFMQKVAQREDDVQLTETQKQQEFEDCFGAIDDAWVKKFKEYVSSLQIRRSAVEDVVGP